MVFFSQGIHKTIAQRAPFWSGSEAPARSFLWKKIFIKFSFEMSLNKLGFLSSTITSTGNFSILRRKENEKFQISAGRTFFFIFIYSCICFILNCVWNVLVPFVLIMKLRSFLFSLPLVMPIRMNLELAWKSISFIKDLMIPKGCSTIKKFLNKKSFIPVISSNAAQTKAFCSVR